MKIKTKEEITEVKLTLSIKEARELYLMCSHTAKLPAAYDYMMALDEAEVVPDDFEQFMEKYYPQYVDNSPGELLF